MLFPESKEHGPWYIPKPTDPVRIRPRVAPVATALAYIEDKTFKMEIRGTDDCGWAYLYDRKSGEQVWDCNSLFAKLHFVDVAEESPFAMDHVIELPEESSFDADHFSEESE